MDALTLSQIVSFSVGALSALGFVIACDMSSRG